MNYNGNWQELGSVEFMRHVIRQPPCCGFYDLWCCLLLVWFGFIDLSWLMQAFFLRFYHVMYIHLFRG
jgi:hypothetical protein